MFHRALHPRRRDAPLERFEVDLVPGRAARLPRPAGGERHEAQAGLRRQRRPRSLNEYQSVPHLPVGQRPEVCRDGRHRGQRAVDGVPATFCGRRGRGPSPTAAWPGSAGAPCGRAWVWTSRSASACAGHPHGRPDPQAGSRRRGKRASSSTRSNWKPSWRCVTVRGSPRAPALPPARGCASGRAACRRAGRGHGAPGLGRWAPMPARERAGAALAMTREPAVLADAIAVGARLEERLLLRPGRDRDRFPEPPAPHAGAWPAATVAPDGASLDRSYR